MYLRSGKIRMIIPSLSNFDYTQNMVKQTLLYFCLVNMQFPKQTLATIL